MVCSRAHHKADSNNEVCLYFPTSSSCWRFLWHIRTMRTQCLAVPLEARQRSASSARPGQPWKHRAPRAQNLPHPAAGGSRTEPRRPQTCSWCGDGPRLPKLLHSTRLRFLVVLYMLGDKLETPIQHTLVMLYCQLSKHLFQAELTGSFLNCSCCESHFPNIFR